MNAVTKTSIPLLDLDLLRTLDAIAEGGSFSAAAQLVFRTPSAVSMQVKKMEEIVGRPIFDRDSRSVRFTEDGAFLLTHARRMLALNREALARFVTPDLHGVVRLGAPDDVAELYISGMLRRFACTHPGVTVNAVVDNSEPLAQAVRRGDLDLVLYNLADDPSVIGNCEVVLRERLVWATKAGGLAHERDPLPVSAWNESCCWRNAAAQALDADGRPWRLAFQSPHIGGQRAAILADLAIAPLPDSALDDEIVEVPHHVGLPDLQGSVVVLAVADGAPSHVRAAADHLRASFAQCC
ncbi:MAG: LysR family transcriptional regulator [Pseudomonadota bacterium]